MHVLHQYCEASRWLEQSECSNTTTLSVAFRRPGEGYTFKPASISQRMIAAIRCIDTPVAFSMASKITSNVFDHLSPFQDEVIMQPYGARIPVVASLEYVKERIFEIKQCLAVLVREERVVLLWANSVEAASVHGSEVEHMLMESVRPSPVVSTPRTLLRLCRSGVPLSVLHGCVPMRTLRYLYCGQNLAAVLRTQD